jgi:hypothetical protein
VFSKKTLLVSVVFCLGLIISVNSVTFAASINDSNTITVTAVIEPTRHIIVNKAQRIIEVLTNTPLLVIPTVSIASLSGNSLPLSTNISSQYKHIIESCNFNKSYGVIYDNGYCTNQIAISQPKKSSLSTLISSLAADSLGLFIGQIKI